MPTQEYTLDTDGVWKARGLPPINGVTEPPDPGTTDRDLLTYGAYKPSADTAGLLPGRTLVPHYGDLTVSAAGTIYWDTDFYGKVSVTAAGVEFHSCRFRGKQINTTRTGQDSSSAMLQCTNAAVDNLLISDCLLYADYPSNTQNGVLGHDFTLLRCEIVRASDGIGCYNAADHTAINVTIKGCWMHDMWFVQPSDTGGRPEGTHNDNMQLSGGYGYLIEGNRLECFIDPASQVLTNPHYPYLTGTGCVTVTPVTTGTGTGAGAVPMRDIIIRSNWMDGGGAEVNISQGPSGQPIASTAITGIEVTGNRYGRGRRPDQGDVASGVVGYITAASKAVATISGEVWEDAAGAPGPTIANG